MGLRFVYIKGAQGLCKWKCKTRVILQIFLECWPCWSWVCLMMYDCSAHFTSDSLAVCLTGVPSWCFVLVILREDVGNVCYYSIPMTLFGAQRKELKLFGCDVRITHIRSDLVRRSGDHHVWWFLQWSSSSELIDPLSMEVDVTNHDLVAFEFWLGPVSQQKYFFLSYLWGWWFSHTSK